MTGNQASRTRQEIIAPYNKSLLKINLSIFPGYIAEYMVPSVMGSTEKYQTVKHRIVRMR